MGEWFKPSLSKSDVAERSPWVRIPLPPLLLEVGVPRHYVVGAPPNGSVPENPTPAVALSHEKASKSFCRSGCRCTGLFRRRQLGFTCAASSGKSQGFGLEAADGTPQ